MLSAPLSPPPGALPGVGTSSIMPGLRRRRAPPRLVLAPGLSSHAPVTAATTGGPPALPPPPVPDAGEDAILAIAACAYKTGPVQILPGLYLSDERTANDPSVLERYRITTVLTVAAECAFPPLSHSSGPPANAAAASPQPRSGRSSGLRTATSTPNLRARLSNRLVGSPPLPANTKMMRFPPDPSTGRGWNIDCVLLPWTHDQSDLAVPQCGFAAACAVIASGLGLPIDAHGVLDLSAPRPDPVADRKNVLVHCQCGVSRSATAVIAYVMLAAALAYHPEVATVHGMHDAYALVKAASQAVSPNCSLLVQLVEWERHLATLSQLSPSQGHHQTPQTPVSSHLPPTTQLEAEPVLPQPLPHDPDPSSPHPSHQGSYLSVTSPLAPPDRTHLIVPTLRPPGENPHSPSGHRTHFVRQSHAPREVRDILDPLQPSGAPCSPAKMAFDVPSTTVSKKRGRRPTRSPSRSSRSRPGALPREGARDLYREGVPPVRPFGTANSSPSLRRQLHRRTFSTDVSLLAPPGLTYAGSGTLDPGQSSRRD